MPRIEFRVARAALTAAQMAAAEAWLARAGWRSAGQAAAAAFAAAGAEQMPPLRARDSVAGGIYFEPAAADAGDAAVPGEWFYAMAKTPGPRREPELEIGIIGPPRAGTSPLAVWMAVWAAALAAVAPLVEVSWRDPARPVRLAPLLASGAYARPRLRLAELDQAALLSESGQREWLRRLQQAGAVREADLAGESEAARGQLRRLATAQLAQPVQAAGAAAYAAAPAGQQAAQEWPLVWLSQQLSLLGCGAVAWPVGRPAGELAPAAGAAMPPHVAAEFGGRLWGLVCTPGAWDAAAARAWERQRARWGWGQAVIIALSGVTAPLPPAAAGRAAQDLETGAGLLAAAFAAAARDYAAQRLAPLERAYGWPLAAMLAQRFPPPRG